MARTLPKTSQTRPRTAGMSRRELRLGPSAGTTKPRKSSGSTAFTPTCSTTPASTASGARARLSMPTRLPSETRPSARQMLIATGSWPFVPEFPGSEHVITSNEAFISKNCRKRRRGRRRLHRGGVRRHFCRPGCRVDLVYRGPLFLRGFDNGVREFVQNELAAKDINLRFETTIEAIQLRENTACCS